jgi:hypothetical protein
MSAVTGAVSQAMVSQMNFSMAMVKKQTEAQQGLIEMIAASADALRGQTLDIAV